MQKIAAQCFLKQVAVKFKMSCFFSCSSKISQFKHSIYFLCSVVNNTITIFVFNNKNDRFRSVNKLILTINNKFIFTLNNMHNINFISFKKKRILV